jgi:hypothetical protein
MKDPERLLVWLLRLFGASTLIALGAVFMPHDWMNLIHQRLGMGDLPDLPIVGYLILVSRDVRRYLPIIRFFGVASAGMGVLLFGLDLAVGMPVFWTVAEGPPVVALGLVILLLARRVKVGPPTSPAE